MASPTLLDSISSLVAACGANPVGAIAVVCLGALAGGVALVWILRPRKEL